MIQDRRLRVAASATRNGIDFVAVDVSQIKLRVHFLNAIDLTTTGPTSVTIRGGDVIPTVAVSATTYTASNPVTGTRPNLTVEVQTPGDFSQYTLTLGSPELDPYFASLQFSFKANCETGFDCRPSDVVPTAAATNLPPIDYLAKDFLSFRQALLDFSARSAPGWHERSSADFGVMMLEAFCAVADELSYLQDRVHNEPSIEHATERVSVTRLARLVDYEPKPATAARTSLRMDVKANTAVPTGFPVTARTPDGRSLPFEVGHGLIDPKTGLRRSLESFPLLENRSVLTPYLWDDADQCLRTGATELWVKGHGYGFTKFNRLLIETQPAIEGNPPIREWVRLRAAGVETKDDLLVPEVPLTKLLLETPMQFEHDLSTKLRNGNLVPMTTVHGNIVPATQGRTIRDEGFAIPGDTTPLTARQAIWRTGPRGDDGQITEQFLYPLETDDRIAWLQPEDGGRAVPELTLIEQVNGVPEPWVWRRWLLEAKRFDKAFMLDPVRYRRITTDPDQPASYEYDGEGDTIRFGFRGLCNVPNANAKFEAIYRIADGVAGNVSQDTVTGFDPSAAPDVMSVTNPFPATGGDDAESLTHIRDHAPQAFRVERLRAVRPDDYRRAAEELLWVQRAGATFRWSGSWLTGFVAVDPVDGREPSVPQSLELTQLLNRRRLAGCEVYVAPPRFIAFDIHLEVCAAADAYSGHVAELVRRALSSVPGAFFDPDNFTFGSSLRRSAIEDTVQRVSGVGGVVCIRVRRRGQTAFEEMPETIAVGANEIIQVASDPNRPDRGRVDIVVRGGR